MNDEIKKLFSTECYIKDKEFYAEIRLHELDKIADYITYLQQLEQDHQETNATLMSELAKLKEENERLKQEQEYNNYCDEQLRKKISNLEYKITTLEDYKSRCEKAIEYLDKVETLAMLDGKIIFSINIFRNILQNGSDDND